MGRQPPLDAPLFRMRISIRTGGDRLTRDFSIPISAAIVSDGIAMAKAPALTLLRRGSDLASGTSQLDILNQGKQTPRFESCLQKSGLETLRAESIEILQVNVGKLCNMTCQHCHVDAGPDRREIMTRKTIDHCLSAIDQCQISTVDLTGGAPEMNPDFCYFVEQAKSRNCHVIDRCNLTILLANGFKHIPDFLAKHNVEVVASLPCYLEENTDSQRGDGAFQASIRALRILNELGYGYPGTNRQLTLVYNPVGVNLPPDQKALEEQYREVLRRDFSIEFNQLFTITNMPISRFLEYLLHQGQYEQYMETLVDAFNPAAVAGLMCRGLISVGWDGRLHDCDFNQMLELPLDTSCPQTIVDFDAEVLSKRTIATNQHCFGCTAGSGSGCLGATL